MERNRILRYGQVLATVIYWMSLAIGLLLTAGLVIWLINPGTLSSISIENAYKTGFGIGTFTADGDSGTPLSELASGMMFWLYFRGVFFAGIVLLISRKSLAILESIKELKIFYSDNIDHFRDLARIGFIAFLFSCFNIAYIDNNISFMFTFAMGPLVFAVSCLVLSEVFREGKHLLEENDMFV